MSQLDQLTVLTLQLELRKMQYQERIQLRDRIQELADKAPNETEKDILLIAVLEINELLNEVEALISEAEASLKRLRDRINPV